MIKESFPREVRLEQSRKEEPALVGREGREGTVPPCRAVSPSSRCCRKVKAWEDNNVQWG